MAKYQGMGYPWGNTLKSYFEVKIDKDILRTSIINILFTMLGERVMNNEFGSRLVEKVFEPADEMLASELAGIVADVVTRLDPRLEVVDVKVQLSEDVDNTANVVVVYRSKIDPFYQDSFAFPLGSSFGSIKTTLS